MSEIKIEEKSFSTVIYLNDKEIGFMNFTIRNKSKMLIITDFFIKPYYRNQGIGAEALRQVINKNKRKYDIICCFLDKYSKVLDLFNRVGKVYNCCEEETDHEYYVEFWNNDNSKI